MLRPEKISITIACSNSSNCCSNSKTCSIFKDLRWCTIKPMWGKPQLNNSNNSNSPVTVISSEEETFLAPHRRLYSLHLHLMLPWPCSAIKRRPLPTWTPGTAISWGPLSIPSSPPSSHILSDHSFFPPILLLYLSNNLSSSNRSHHSRW